MRNEYKILGETTVIFINYKGDKFETFVDTKDLPKITKSVSLLIKKRKDGTVKGY